MKTWRRVGSELVLILVIAAAAAFDFTAMDLPTRSI
jgi:hypothetical protein